MKICYFTQDVIVQEPEERVRSQHEIRHHTTCYCKCAPQKGVANILNRTQSTPQVSPKAL
jgi:hypothetical protein